MRFRAILWTIFVFAGLNLAPAHARAKKTVCTVTINSSNEREVFKRSLRAEDFDFVELLPTEKSGQKVNQSSLEHALPDWLEHACQAKIQCDMLVISGHFGGYFFGSSGFDLSVEQLERAACRPECAGVIKQPKEVFLFGCNTLAGKSKDVRTPQKYLADLLSDNMDRADAEQAVAIRYSPWGDKMFSRMAGTFMGAAKIYGFDSIGPKGNTVTPRLEKYFKLGPKDYSSYLDQLNNKSVPNAAWKTAMSDTTFAEAIGQVPRTRAPICYLESEKIPRISKLRFVEQQLGGPEPLLSAPAIASWVRNNSNHEKPEDWSGEEWEMWDRLTWNPRIKDQFLSAATQVHGLPSIEAQIFHFAMDMRWISEQTFAQKLTDMALPFLKDKKVSDGELAALCAMNEKVSIDRSALGLNLKGFKVFWALACLGNYDDEMTKAATRFLSSKNEDERGAGIIYFYYAVLNGKYRRFSGEPLRSALRLEKRSDYQSLLMASIGGAADAHALKDLWSELARTIRSTQKADEINSVYAYVYLYDGLPSEVLSAIGDRLFSVPYSAWGTSRADASDLAILALWQVALSKDGVSAEEIAKKLVALEGTDNFVNYLSYTLTTSGMASPDRRRAILKAFLARTQNTVFKASGNDWLSQIH